MSTQKGKPTVKTAKELLTLIKDTFDGAFGSTSQTCATAPDGTEIHTDIGYAEEFFNKFIETFEIEDCIIKKSKQMNTVYSQEEIIESLKVIKETCQKAKACIDCPFYADNGEIARSCALMKSIPKAWQLVDANSIVWRAFQ